jgi:predicted ester cyclase
MSVRTILVFIAAALCLVLAAAGGFTIARVNQRSRLERNKALVRQMHANVWSETDRDKVAEAIRQLYTPEFVVHDWTGDHKLDAKGLMKKWEFERAAFIGLREDVQAIIAEGDLIVDRFFSAGMQARDLDPIPHHSPGVRNQSKKLDMPEMEMFRVVDGKLAEQWLFNDIWAAHAQLGLFDPDHWRESICGSRNATSEVKKAK